MEPKGWRNWKEVPYRGQPESKSYKSNRYIKFSKLEKWVNIISVVFLGSLSFVAIFFAIRNFQNHNTDDMFALIVLSIAGLMFTFAVSQGVISTMMRKRGSLTNKKKTRKSSNDNPESLD